MSEKFCPLQYIYTNSPACADKSEGGAVGAGGGGDWGRWGWVAWVGRSPGWVAGVGGSEKWVFSDDRDDGDSDSLLACLRGAQICALGGV